MKIVQKLLITSTLLILASSANAQATSPEEKFIAFGEAYQFVFFSVIEGLYRDGASQDDVNQILMKQSDEHWYEHFIYSCEICTSTLLAFQLYQSRPKFSMYKNPNKNKSFGPGFSEETQSKLHSNDVKIRLEAIHSLVSKWIRQRMDNMNLSDEKRSSLYRAFEDGREQGMSALQTFKQDPETIKRYAPGYADLDECAICNASVNMDFK